MRLEMTDVKYLKGDATCPQAKGTKIITHVCNDLGRWGKGFVMALSGRWSEPERAYRDWHRGRADNDFGLGSVMFVQVEPYIWVANMVAQHGVNGSSRMPPIRYEAVEACLSKVAQKAQELNASVHMPRIGCGLAGGKWDEIEPIIVKTLCENEVSVTVYDLASE
jgi:O-acetyl-ADP-ribose deacetylase (regulator of RNase III)